MLKENQPIIEEVNLMNWHQAGYSGHNVNILILDFNGKIFDHMKSYATVLDPKEPDMNDSAGHNTYVAQVAHAAAPNSHIYVAPWTHDSEEIVNWVRQNPDLIDVVNISLTSPNVDHYRKLYNVFNELNIPVCCSSGNDHDKGRQGVNFPANLTHTIAVGAYNWKNDYVVDYSNGGEDLICVSPTNVYVKRENGEPFPYTGTSTASPFAAGMLACYIQWRKEQGLPKLGCMEAIEFIKENCIDIEDKGFDYPSGHGLFCMPKEIPDTPKKEVNEVTNAKVIYEKEVVTIAKENKSVSAVIIDGTTYVPIREVADLLDLKLSYDNKTKTSTLKK